MVRMSLIALLLVTGAAGCTDTGGKYPSLLPREIEKQSLAEPERPVAIATPDAALDKQIADLDAEVDKASTDFTAAAQSAEARIAVARGLPQGSDGWLDAQAALSEVEAAQAPLASTLADLQRLAIDRGTAGLPPYPALDTAIAKAGALTDAQAARHAALEAAAGGQ
jgi:hypothetical protein